MLFFSSNLFAKCNIDYLKYKPNLKIEKLLKDKNIPIGISKAYARKKFSYLTRFKSSSDFYFDPNVTSTTGNYCNYCSKNDGFATIDYYNIYSSEGALENMSYCITFDNHQDIYKIYEEFKKKI